MASRKRLMHRRKPPILAAPHSRDFDSLGVHMAALKRPCPQCGGAMYRDSWGDPPNEIKLHGCAVCGFERRANGKPWELNPTEQEPANG